MASVLACQRPLLVVASSGRGSKRVGGYGGKFDVPKRLLSAQPDPQAAGVGGTDSTVGSANSPGSTVYTVRLSTGVRRGAALSDPAAGVLVCLVGAGGGAFLHRVPPLNDPAAAEAELRRICEVVDPEAGANCQLALEAAAEAAQAGAAAKRRFQEGSKDEVCVLGPPLGALSALLVAPEGGSWYCDEVDVSSSRDGHTDRFVCRELLGAGGAAPAAFLRPVPPEAVVYGSGDSALVLSQQQAKALRALGMAEYATLKARLAQVTAALVGAGAVAALAAGGPAVAAPFALGGAGGLVYQAMLARSVDGLGAAQGLAPPQGGPAAAVASPAARMALVSAGLAASLAALHSATGQGDAVLGVQQLGAALAGFLCYKAALLGVAGLGGLAGDGAAAQALVGGGEGASETSPQDDQRAERLDD